MVDLAKHMDDNDVVLYWKTRTDKINEIPVNHDAETQERMEYVAHMKKMKAYRDAATRVRLGTGTKTGLFLQSSKHKRLADTIRKKRENRLHIWLENGIITHKEYDKEMEYLRSEDYERSH